MKHTNEIKPQALLLVLNSLLPEHQGSCADPKELLAETLNSLDLSCLSGDIKEGALFCTQGSELGKIATFNILNEDELNRSVTLKMINYIGYNDLDENIFNICINLSELNPENIEKDVKEVLNNTAQNPDSGHGNTNRIYFYASGREACNLNGAPVGSFQFNEKMAQKHITQPNPRPRFK